MPRASKLNKWWSHYIDSSNQQTFLNGTASAKAAGYKAKSELSFAVIGSQNLKKLKDRMSEWLNDVGMSEESMHMKYLELRDAKESKIIKIKGYISTEDLPDHCTALGTSGLVEETPGKDGETIKKFSAGDTIVEIKTDALAIQQKILDMGYKIKGSYKPEELNINANITGIDIEFIKSKDQDDED